MHLDGLDADAQVVGYLLVPSADRDSIEHFTLPLGQGRKARGCRLPLSPLAPGRRAQGGKLFDQGLFEGGSD
jgi:hypothetical protein